MAKNVLYFGSKSQSRRMLLEESQIPFVMVSQNADESQCDWGLPLPQLVLSIALYKMQHVVLPDGMREGDVCYVLTADTMSHDKMGVIHGKPVDRVDAIAKIKATAAGSFLCTAFCLDRKVWQSGAWVIQERIADVVSAEFIFSVPQQWLDIYLEKTPFLDVSGGIAVEKFGNQFLKTVQGSYSTIIGLPLFELREALEKLDFFDI
ncbi:MAG TPA: Maf family protein [Candidatus Babeliales bacterium]|jgi:septum formation protein|nr:Maf family protein [Candidatus Babeliales bacterium]